MAQARIVMEQDMSLADIKYRVEQLGLSYPDIDRMYGLVVGTCNKAARYPHASGEVAIASVIGFHPADIWPSRYDAKGKRLNPQPHYEQATRKSQVNKLGAA